MRGSLDARAEGSLADSPLGGEDLSMLVKSRWPILLIWMAVLPVGCTEEAPKGSVTTLPTAEVTTTTMVDPTQEIPDQRKVFELEGYPDAISGSLVPWDEVEPGWHLVVFDGSKIGEAGRRPVVLYLVSSPGIVYQVAGLPGTAQILDWAPGGRRAILAIQEREGPSLVLLDVVTGVWETIIEPGTSEGPIRAEFTRPNGRNLVRLTSGGEELQRVSIDGEILAVLAEKPSRGEAELDWLTAPEGGSFVVGDGTKIWSATLDGTVVEEFELPRSATCTPIRWIGDTIVLVGCRGVRYASPHDEYTQLWRFDIASGEGEALTPYTGNPRDFDEDDWGYSGAWTEGGQILFQRSSPCLPGDLNVMRSGEEQTLVWSPVEGMRLVDVVEVGNSEEYYVQTATRCDMSGSRLLRVDVAGRILSVVVSRQFEAIGVVDARGFTSPTAGQ